MYLYTRFISPLKGVANTTHLGFKETTFPSNSVLCIFIGENTEEGLCNFLSPFTFHRKHSGSILAALTTG